MSLLSDVEAFLEQSGMSAYRFGKLSLGDTGLVFRMRAGRAVKRETEASIRAFLAAENLNPSPVVKRGPARSLFCECGAPVSRKSQRCRSCANTTAMEKLQRTMPEDFLSVAPGRTINELQKIYQAGPDAVRRWRKEAGLEPIAPVAPRQPRRTVPDGFALVARGMTMKQLRERFEASEPVVRRWCAETGVEPRRAGYVYRQAAPRPLPDARDCSRAGKAAQFLQKFGPVTRCDADGRVDPKGTHWLRGGRFVLTDAEIMDRATRQGWRPEAWRELAAA